MTMIGQASQYPSKQSSAPQGLTVLLLGLIVCYQVISYLFLHQAVSHADDDFVSDASCTAVAGPSGYSCMESKLFNGWSELPADSAEELDSLLAVTPEKSPPTTSSAAAVPVTATSPSTGLRGDGKSDASAESKDVKPEALESMLWDMAFAMGGGDKSHEAPEKHQHKKPATNAFMAKTVKHKPRKPDFAKGLSDLQQKLEAKMQSQARRHAEHRALRALHMASHGHAQKAPAPHEELLTSAEHNLDELTHDLSDQIKLGMQQWKQEHDAAAKQTDPMTPWAHNLDDLTHDLEEHMQQRTKERAAHVAAQKVQHAARLKAAHAASEAALAEVRSPIIDEVEALGRQMCQDPERRDRPACAQFVHAHASDVPSHKDKHASAIAHIKLLEKHLEELEKDQEHNNEEIHKESTQFLREMCADPARHDYPTCAELLATTTAAPVTGNRLRSSKAAPVAEKKQHAVTAGNLRWSPMKPSELAAQSTQHVGDSPLLVSRQELRGAHWDNKTPKVACVTVLPQGQVTETLMKYFMDNYNLQHYEGERELVIVYHDGDKEASRIAHLYADGTSVKAAAARGGDVYPSATSYRYGAWMGRDADLVVRWDFEAWHHPNRISMQVRAIAHAHRPVSLVTRVTVFDADGKNAAAAGGVGAHGSLMGDAAWMRKHWMPLLEEESAVIHGLHSRDVVQIDMPELLAYHDTSMLVAATSA